MLTHKGCAGNVFTIATVRIISPVNLTYRGIVFTGGTVDNNENGIKWACSCGKEVDQKDIEARCMNCGHVFPLSDLVIPNDYPGIFCRECVGVVAEGQRYALATTTISKIADNRD